MFVFFPEVRSSSLPPLAGRKPSEEAQQRRLPPRVWTDGSLSGRKGEVDALKVEEVNSFLMLMLCSSLFHQHTKIDKCGECY